MPGDRIPSLTDLEGSRVDEARSICEAAGFEVQVVDRERHEFLTLDHRPNRIRLYVRWGKVEEAKRG